MNHIIQAIAPIAVALLIALFALPSYIAAVRQRGFLRGLLIIVSLGVFILAYETLLVKVSLPYAHFAFTSLLGYKILGSTPWVLAFIYPPLVLAAFWLASKKSEGTLRIVFTALFALVAHVVLDPAVARMQLWEWQNPGPFYGVPIVSFGAWLVAGLIAGFILNMLWGSETVKRSLAYSGMIIVLFWAGVNLGLQQWIPAGVGIAVAIFMLIVMRVEKSRQED